MIPNEFVEFPILGDENFANYMEGFDAVSGIAIEDMWLDEKEEMQNSCPDGRPRFMDDHVIRHLKFSLPLSLYIYLSLIYIYIEIIYS